MWANSGKSFVIKKFEEFLRLIPKYFKTKNYSSFVRQLNMYDFNKVKHKKDLHEFKHPIFKRGNFKALTSIKRKVNNNNNNSLN